MKILKLSLMNLASLEGEQVIDFQQEPLKSSDLFSITGATGSGKSTILDAICLALYGCCPRFMAAGKVKFYGDSDFHNDKDLQPHDARNILSRGTKRCFAEVLFLANDGVTYQARWSCEVGRTNYQKAVRKLYKFEPTSEGIVIQKELEIGAKKGDNETINRLIGLDYGQFVRTVLLAQGSFANFIKADDKEKAILLEKLTGTEIYTTIAQKIYQFYKGAADDYATLDMQVKQVAANLLTEEESTALLQQRDEWTNRLKEATDKQKLTEGGLLWWEQLAQLQQAEHQQELLKVEAEQALLALKPQEQELALWDEVAPIQVHYTQLQTTKATVAKVKAAIQMALATRETRLAEERLATEKLAQAKQQHEAVKRLQEEQAPMISKAKIAKATLEELAATLAHQNRELQATSRLREQAAAALQESEKEELVARTKQQEATATLQQLAPHQVMLDDIRVIAASLKECNGYQVKERNDALALEGGKQQLAQTKLKWGVQQAELAKLQNSVRELWERLNEKKEQFAHFNLPLLQQQLVQSNRRVTQLQQWHRLAKEQLERVAQAQLRSEEMQQAEAQMAGYIVLLTDYTAEKATIQKVLPGLEEAYQLTLSKSTEAMRELLVEGEACPLCGATEHPYAHQDVAKLLSPLQLQIESYTQRLKLVEELLNHPETGINGLLNQARGRVEGLKQVLKQLQVTGEQNLQERLTLATYYPEQPLLRETELSAATAQGVDNLLAAASEQVKQADEAMARYTLLQGEISKLQTAFDTEKRVIEETTEQLNKQHTALCAQESRLAEQEKGLEELRLQLTQKRSELQALVTLSGWEQLYETNFEGLLNELRELYQTYTTAKQSEEWATGSLKELAVKLVEQQKMVTTHYQAELRYQTEVAKLQLRQAAEYESYQLLLQGADPFEVERMLKEQVEQADKEERSCTLLHRQATEATSRAKGNYDTLVVQQKEEESTLQTLTERMAQFVEHYNQAKNRLELLTLDRLEQLFQPHREWAELRKQLDKAKGEVTRLVGSKQHCSDELAKHQALPQKPTSDKELLVQEGEAVKLLLEEIDQARQTVSGRWVAHQQALEKVAHFQQELKEKRGVYENWKLLNDILGNKEGDNFRETAQIYTLQFLLKQANVQLALLTRRYRLEQVNNSLSIRIVDRDRADEVRNLSSLSGGETFLVSLSLALGLSSLSSRNISIQNLFVDEGFGTLDAESLSVVIDALSSLHALQGKKVGVISHTAEMKERIHTQIRVVKQGSGGRSLIEID